MEKIKPAKGPDFQLRGFEVYKGFISRGDQVDLVAQLRDIALAAPVFTPETPQGKSMSVRMTSAGAFGWFSDAGGYRYIDQHPSGTAWPKIPDMVLQIWRDLTGITHNPDSCLINFYGENARMGMHQDRDEADFSFPVVSISLGDDGLLRMGGQTRSGQTDTHWLNSGDVVVMGGDARLAYHGIDKIRFRSSTLLPKGGRINLTLRVVR